MPGRVQHGSLRKRRSGGVMKWFASWRDEDAHRTRTLGPASGMTKTEAQAILATIVQEVNERRGVAPYTPAGVHASRRVPVVPAQVEAQHRANQ
jgi:hypothetical protein